MRYGEGEFVIEMEDFFEDRGEVFDGDIFVIMLDEVVVGKIVYGWIGSVEFVGLVSFLFGEVEFCEG